jgi:hypothetical protein
MTKYFHIVQVHPVENGEPNLHKVNLKRKFDSKEAAQSWVNLFNATEVKYDDGTKDRAIYYGCVNDKTGELV